MKMLSTVLLILYFTLFPQNCLCGDAPTVQIRDTVFRGLSYSAAGSMKQVYSFRGIFYAEPPVGSRRFAPPVSKRQFPGVVDATRYGPFCPQNMTTTSIVFPRPFPTTGSETSEDCLHLDVYTPTLDPSDELAVMVFFHGGAFANGGCGYYDGSPLAGFQNVVHVSVNYRLGALGFLSTGDEAAFGNFGLLDQQMALLWVRNNIQAFGGDPRRVTIFGASAGAASVSFHLQSSLSRGFFHRAILQSGVASSPIMVSRYPRLVAARLAEKTQCTTANNRELVQCLRTKTAEEIVAVDMNAPDIPVMPFTPVIDGFFIEEDPMVAMATGKLNTGVELLLGVNNHEGGYSNLANRMSADVFTNFSVHTFRLLLQYELQKMIPGDIGEVTESIELLYGGSEGLTDDTALPQLTEVVSDLLYVSPATAMADTMTAAGSRVYFYEYQHRLSCSRAPAWVRADHGDEEAIVFGFPFLGETELGHLSFTPEERDLSQTLMAYWANFAKTGNPNGDGSMAGVPYWPRYTVKDKNYQKLDVTCRPSTHLKRDKVTFWSQLMNSVYQQATRDEL